MSEYIRTTRECSVTEFHPEILQAIQNYFQEHRLGNLQADVLICCETISRKKSTGKTISWLNGRPDTIIHTGMLLTSQWLIWVHHGDQSGTRSNAANLTQIQVEYYAYPLTKDAGLEIVGYISDTKARVRGYIGMGADLAAHEFCEAVKQEIIKVNPPTQRGLFGWRAG